MTQPRGEVADAEDVYRRVCEQVGPDQFCFRVESSGRVTFLHAAFNDSARSPSVDRAELVDRNPHRTRIEQRYGVVTLNVMAIRERIGPIPKLDKKGRDTGEAFVVHVRPDPEVGNCAHAVVYMQPKNPNDRTFRKLKDALARLATEVGWTVEPNLELPPQRRSVLRELGRCLIYRLQGRV